MVKALGGGYHFGMRAAMSGTVMSSRKPPQNSRLKVAPKDRVAPVPQEPMYMSSAKTMTTIGMVGGTLAGC